MGGPGGAGTAGVELGGSSDTTGGVAGRRNLALERQMAANSRVGAGMAADWECTSELQTDIDKHKERKRECVCVCMENSFAYSWSEVLTEFDIGATTSFL